MHRTELENHLIEWHRHNNPNNGFLDGVEDDEADQHVLVEFAKGYKENRESYASSKEDEELIDEFLRVAEKDIDGSYEYQVKDFEKVLAALNKFGL